MLDMQYRGYYTLDAKWGKPLTRLMPPNVAGRASDLPFSFLITFKINFALDNSGVLCFTASRRKAV
jgi:hypothetical protein